MSLYLLATIVGILGGVLILVVIFSLLSLAQKGEAYLDQMGLGEGGGWLKNRQNGAGESLTRAHENYGVWSRLLSLLNA